MLAPVSFARDDLSEDVRQVRRASQLLRIPEFAFFRLAHRRWYGRDADDREIEPFFMLYLFRRRVPPWVRHLARQVTGESRHRPIHPQAYGATPVLPPPPEPSRTPALILGVFYAACFVAFTLAAF